MPVSKIENVTDQGLIGIWNITESEEELLSLFNQKFPFNDKLNELKVSYKRMEWMASRLLIAHVCELSNIEFTDLDKDENGKPFIRNSSFEISLSHSFPYVAVILDKNKEVGIDVEKPREKLKLIEKKFLSNKEIAHCRDNIIKLCILWSAKEAIYKIYAKRGLTFKTDMYVKPFELSTSGMIDGTLTINDYQKSFKLHYEQFDGHVLVYNLN